MNSDAKVRISKCQSSATGPKELKIVPALISMTIIVTVREITSH